MDVNGRSWWTGTCGEAKPSTKIADAKNDRFESNFRRNGRWRREPNGFVYFSKTKKEENANIFIIELSLSSYSVCLYSVQDSVIAHLISLR